MELFAVANRYGIDSLLFKCGAYLSETINNEKNVCALLEMGYVYNETHLYEVQIIYIPNLAS